MNRVVSAYIDRICAVYCSIFCVSDEKLINSSLQQVIRKQHATEYLGRHLLMTHELERDALRSGEWKCSYKKERMEAGACSPTNGTANRGPPQIPVQFFGK